MADISTASPSCAEFERLPGRITDASLARSTLGRLDETERLLRGIIDNVPDKESGEEAYELHVDAIVTGSLRPVRSGSRGGHLRLSRQTRRSPTTDSRVGRRQRGSQARSNARPWCSIPTTSNSGQGSPSCSETPSPAKWSSSASPSLREPIGTASPPHRAFATSASSPSSRRSSTDRGPERQGASRRRDWSGSESAFTWTCTCPVPAFEEDPRLPAASVLAETPAGGSRDQWAARPRPA